MSDLSKQDIALMNAEMAARIFMHIAQDQATAPAACAKSPLLSDEEQQALRDLFGAAEPSPDPHNGGPAAAP